MTSVHESGLPGKPVSTQKLVGLPKVALVVLTLAASVFLLRLAEDFFIPVVLAVLVSHALNPIVKWLECLHIPRALATAVVLIGLVAVAGYGAYRLRHQAAAILESLPEAVENVRAKVRRVRRDASEPGPLQNLEQTAKGIETVAAEAAGASSGADSATKVQIEPPGFRAADVIWSGSRSLLGLASQVVMVLFLAYFLLASGDLFKRKCLRLFGPGLSDKRLALTAINESSEQIARFLFIQVLTSLIVGACAAAALSAFGVSQPIVWGLAAGLLNTIPYFGPIIVTGSVALVVLLQFGSLISVLKVSIAILLITTLDGYLLTPLLMGKAARINGVAMFVGLMFWGWIWGVTGMILGAPILMVAKSVCDRTESLRTVGELLGE